MWPESFPSFLPSIENALKKPETCLVGVILIKITSEQFMSNVEDVPAARKRIIRELMVKHVPQLLASIVGILKSLMGQFTKEVDGRVEANFTSEASVLCKAILGDFFLKGYDVFFLILE